MSSTDPPTAAPGLGWPTDEPSGRPAPGLGWPGSTPSTPDPAVPIAEERP